MSSDHAEAVRLQKFLADAGVCSRRAAEALIRDGAVWVNGKVAELGQRVSPGTDKVVVSGEVVKPPRTAPIVLAVNKPRGVVCTERDPHGTRTIFDLVPPPYAAMRWHCAGRLEKDSEGLVILTTDGELANRLTHPSGLVTRHFRVSLREPFPAEDLGRLMRGVTFDDERLRADHARLVGRGMTAASTEVDVETHQARKRDLRQLFLALGYTVKRLRCYQIGRFSLKGFPLRALKRLTDSEVALLLVVPPR